MFGIIPPDFVSTTTPSNRKVRTFCVQITSYTWKQSVRLEPVWIVTAEFATWFTPGRFPYQYAVLYSLGRLPRASTMSISPCVGHWSP